MNLRRIVVFFIFHSRVWVFIMSCCISSAVCCVLITSSMSGVALGYNYSLSEYIDTKETNVSVFIKRGVFDDDVVNEMVDWRRSGDEKPTNSEDARKNVKADNTEVGPDEIPDGSGRRLDDSIVRSNDNNNFEGALMKITLKPPVPLTSTEAPVMDDRAMEPAMASHPPGSLDQLKAIQAVINARRAEAARNPLETSGARSMYGPDRDVNPYINNGPANLEVVRRMMDGYGHERPGVVDELRPDQIPVVNPARFAVPSYLSQGNWEFPQKLQEEFIKRKSGLIPDIPPPMPQTVTYRAGPIRPTTDFDSKWREQMLQKLATAEGQKVIQPEQSTQKEFEKPIDEDKKRNEEKFDERSDSDDDMKKEFLNKMSGPKIVAKDTNDYYEEDLKGLPVRRRRSINNEKAKLKPQAKLKKAMPQKFNPRLLSKFKVSESISNEITDYPSILVSKLHFLNNARSNGTETNEIEVNNGTKPIQVVVNDTVPITDSTIDGVLKIIQSMFS